jgi:ABC-2 type transport system permease protein
VSPRLFWSVLTTEARTRLSYRVDFWVSAVGAFVAELGLAWFLWDSLYRESGVRTIGGYTRDGMVLYSVAVILFGKLIRGSEFGEGVISTEIYEGKLSRYLVYPTSYLGMKYAQQSGTLAPALVNLFLFGAATALLLPVPDEVRLTPASVAMGLVAVLAANVLHFLLSWSVQSIAFWADNVWSLTVAQRITTSLLGGAMVPLTAFPDRAEGVLRALPFRFLYAFPAEALLGRVPFLAWLEGLAVAALWCGLLAVLGRAVWRRGRLRYTGVGM